MCCTIALPSNACFAAEHNFEFPIKHRHSSITQPVNVSCRRYSREETNIDAAETSQPFLIGENLVWRDSMGLTWALSCSR